MQLTYLADLVYAACMATLCMVKEGVHVCASSAASVVQAGSAQHIQHDTPLTCRTARGEDGLLLCTACAAGQWDDVFSVHWSVVRVLLNFFFFSLACPSFARRRAGPRFIVLQ